MQDLSAELVNLADDKIKHEIANLKAVQSKAASLAALYARELKRRQKNKKNSGEALLSDSLPPTITSTK